MEMIMIYLLYYLAQWLLIKEEFVHKLNCYKYGKGESQNEFYGVGSNIAEWTHGQIDRDRDIKSVSIVCV